MKLGEILAEKFIGCFYTIAWWICYIIDYFKRKK